MSKIIFEKWWNKGNKVFSIINYKNNWKENGNKPLLSYRNNGGKAKYGDICFDSTLIIGYTVIRYTNFGLNGRKCDNCIKQHTMDCPNSSECISLLTLPHFAPKIIKKNTIKSKRWKNEISFNINTAKMVQENRLGKKDNRSQKDCTEVGNAV